MHCTTQEACGSVTLYCFCLYICEVAAAVTVSAECFQWVLCRNICLSLSLCVLSVCVCVFVPRAELPCCFPLSVYVLHPALYMRVHRVRGRPRPFCVSAADVAPGCVSTYRAGSVWRLMSSGGGGGGGGGLISAPVECDYKQPGRRNK